MHGWQVLAVGKGLVLGPTLTLEKAVGELLSMPPPIVATTVVSPAPRA